MLAMQSAKAPPGDEVQGKDVNQQPVDHSSAKDAAVHGVNDAASSAQGPCIALADVKKSITCNICHSLIASSLVLSCGHQYCGSCLFEWLGSKASCPNCQVPLRAIPVRCIALDGVIEAFLPYLPKPEVDAYRSRQEEGKSAANKVNKMFWWLQPSAIPPSNGNAFGMQGPMAPAGLPKQPGPAPQPLHHHHHPHHNPAPANGYHHQQASSQQGGGFSQGGGMPPPAGGHFRRSSQPGALMAAVAQQSNGGSSRASRQNSFSGGGAPGPMMAAAVQAAQQPSMAAQLGYAPGQAQELELELLTQQLAAAGMAYPMMYQQQQRMQQYAGFISDLSGGGAVEMGTSPTTQPTTYESAQQFQQLFQGMYFG